ncbi:hypothetical protein KCMC57_up57010 [Kitasatospora sp. CMC57]|uniref:Uncharacterized protein n=1 Tax=Kitasatospora sp. CMC57 TaxID=3231513 RepID=A0AB33K970_9ACTN
MTLLDLQGLTPEPSAAPAGSRASKGCNNRYSALSLLCGLWIL